jgi:hypothetical protein
MASTSTTPPRAVNAASTFVCFIAAIANKTIELQQSNVPSHTHDNLIMDIASETANTVYCNLHISTDPNV